MNMLGSLVGMLIFGSCLVFLFIAFCEVQIFQVKTAESPKKDHPSDSEEFDHFYD